MKISFTKILIASFSFILLSALVLLVVNLSNPESKLFSGKDGVDEDVKQNVVVNKESEDNEVEKSEEIEDKEVQVSKSDFEVGKSINLGNFEVTVSNLTLAKDYKGNDALIIEYSWMNNSEETISPLLSISIKGYQDGVETDTAVIAGEKFSSEASMKDVRPGGKLDTVQESIGIEDLSKPLELEFKELFSWDNKGNKVLVVDLSKLK